MSKGRKGEKERVRGKKREIREKMRKKKGERNQSSSKCHQENK